MENVLSKYQPVTLSLENRKAVAESRISFGNSSALALRDAIAQKGKVNETVAGVFYRLSVCALPSNHWIADDLHNWETGELYAGNGTFSACGSKLCPNCIAKASNRSRKELNLALKNQKLFTGESYKFITLTVPNPDLPLLKTRSVLDRALTLFRKREYFINHIRGGSKSEEFTVTNNGYHYHYHLFCLTRFISYEKLRREWTDCVRIAFAEFGLPFEINNKDGLLSVVVKKIDSSRSGLKSAVQEVCKYITKSDSWESIPQKDLLEIASIKRFPRMFELFRYFRDQRNVNAVLNYPHPFITYLLLNAVLQILEKVKEIIEAVESHTILDTKQISDGIISDLLKFSGVSPPEQKKKRARQMNWRDHIEHFGLEDYLKRLTNDVERAWEFRRSVLRRKYPYALFKTLDGEVF